MQHEEMQGIYRRGEAFDIQNVARGRSSGHRWYAQGITLEQRKGERRIQKGHVDASTVGRMGHHIFVSGGAKQGTAGEITHNAVVFHLAQSHHIGQCPGRTFASAGDNLLTDAVQFLPIPRHRPMFGGIGQEFLIGFLWVVGAVEKIFAVELHQGKDREQQNEQSIHRF